MFDNELQVPTRNFFLSAGLGMFLQDLQARTPIAWGKMSDDRWAVLDSAVFGKLHPCQSLSKRVKLLEDSIYEERAKIFGHSPSHHKNHKPSYCSFHHLNK